MDGIAKYNIDLKVLLFSKLIDFIQARIIHLQKMLSNKYQG